MKPKTPAGKPSGSAKTTPEKPYLLDSADGKTKDMPSVTKLLNRKKLGLSSTSEPLPPQNPPPGFELAPAAPSSLGGVKPRPQAAGTRTGIAIPEGAAGASFELTSPGIRTLAAAPPVPEAPVESSTSSTPELSGQTFAGQTQLVAVQVVPSARAARRGTEQPLTLWSRTLAQSSSDPVQVASVQLFEKGALATLYLSLQETRTAPRLSATAAMASGPEAILWQGLHWDTSATGQLWATISRTGLLEIRPTEVDGPQGILRIALGVRATQHLSLLRVGNSSQCAGVLAVISGQSLQAVLPELRAQLMSASAPNLSLAA